MMSTIRYNPAIQKNNSGESGKMNIPLNFWASIPTKDGFRIGISVGYNSKK